MWFPQIPDDIILLQDLPATSEEAGSESNSISLNFGGGFFGGTPTGNAGMTISNSVTETAPDFEISNMSSGTNMVHLYTLHLVEGAVYRNPTDLVNFLDFCNLRELPARAKETFPVLSQALFHAPKGLTKQAALHIEIDQLLMRITKTWYPIKPVVEYDDHTYSNAWDIPIDFGSVA